VFDINGNPVTSQKTKQEASCLVVPRNTEYLIRYEATKEIIFSSIFKSVSLSLHLFISSSLHLLISSSLDFFISSSLHLFIS